MERGMERWRDGERYGERDGEGWRGMEIWGEDRGIDGDGKPKSRLELTEGNITKMEGRDGKMEGWIDGWR
jgi:hypothetical protein